MAVQSASTNFTLAANAEPLQTEIVTQEFVWNKSKTFPIKWRWITTCPSRLSELPYGAQRAKFARKVHKPPLGVNVINFELNGFNVFLWVPWSLSESKVFKFTKYVERNKMHFCP